MPQTPASARFRFLRRTARLVCWPFGLMAHHRKDLEKTAIIAVAALALSYVIQREKNNADEAAARRNTQIELWRARREMQSRLATQFAPSLTSAYDMRKAWIAAVSLPASSAIEDPALREKAKADFDVALALFRERRDAYLRMPQVGVMLAEAEGLYLHTSASREVGRVRRGIQSLLNEHDCDTPEKLKVQYDTVNNDFDALMSTMGVALAVPVE